MESFSARLNAVEGSYFRNEQHNAVKAHVERLIQQGELPHTAMETFSERLTRPFGQNSAAEVPTTVINARPASEVVFRYDGVPVPRNSASASWARTTKVSLGRSRWSPEGTSIFSISDGKRLAQTPPKEPTAWELNRAKKIARAAVDERVVQGLRLMPEYTPARAMLWGSILAIWGTATLTAAVARSLDIHTAAEASEKFGGVMRPIVERSKQALEPIRERMAAQRDAGIQSSLLPMQELARRMRDNLGQHH